MLESRWLADDVTNRALHLRCFANAVNFNREIQTSCTAMHAVDASIISAENRPWLEMSRGGTPTIPQLVMPIKQISIRAPVRRRSMAVALASCITSCTVVYMHFVLSLPNPYLAIKALSIAQDSHKRRRKTIMCRRKKIGLNVTSNRGNVETAHWGRKR